MNVRLGITGGIGSGKSFVCRLLEERFHIPIYYCDAEAKRLNVEHPLIRQALSDLVGADTYCADGSLNKAFLARYLFSDPSHTRKVNAIVHPHLKADFEQWAKRQTAPIVATESAILFESGMDKLVDSCVVVTAPLELRIQRVMQRDQIAESAAWQRINAQLDEQKRIEQADHIILNDGIEPLIPQLERLIKFF
ncbi:MAG: dephospho-CoA kinase [Bacteroidaceae bacterium]|nr:dephospho-CoA kinase [Bacteroidaceae bacterium]